MGGLLNSLGFGLEVEGMYLANDIFVGDSGLLLSSVVEVNE